MRLRRDCIFVCLIGMVLAGCTPREKHAATPRAPVATELAHDVKPRTFAPQSRPSVRRGVDDEDGLTDLHRAAERGDAPEVSRLLAAGADANARGVGRRSAGFTPLHMTMAGAFNDAMARSMAPPEARQRGEQWSMAKARARERETRGQQHPQRGPMQFAEVTRLLLANGADASATTPDGLSPLHAAVQTFNVELVSLLIAAKADVNAVQRPRGGPERSVLVYAAGTDVDTVRTLLDASADISKVPESARGFFLSRAMMDIEVFRLLLDRGMELPPDALSRATRNGHVEIAEEIIRRGKAKDHDVALYAAVDNDERSPEEEANRLKTVRTLLDAGASPSAPNGTGEALVAAVAQGHTAVAKLLQERGGKVDWSRLKDDEHKPHFIAYAAAFENRIDRLRGFESLGMPLDVLGASILGRTERLRELMESKQATVAGEAGSTALCFAAGYGHIDCVRTLLDAGTDVNARMPSWDTPDIGPRPLTSAAEQGHVEIVRLLLDRGANRTLLEFDEEERAALKPEVRALLYPAGDE